MYEKIYPDNMHIVNKAIRAMEKLGISPEIMPVRGGTDGAMLTYKGLPCPNLGTGGYGFHGPFEHISVEDMDVSVKVVLAIIENIIK